MCEFYTGADPILYESRTRSIRIDGVLTTIRLENLVWDTLVKMAEDESTSTNALIAQLYREVYALRGECPNFASFLRVTCLRYLERRLSLQSGTTEPTRDSVSPVSRKAANLYSV